MAAAENWRGGHRMDENELEIVVDNEYAAEIF
jgi:hypothetical protein